MFQPTLLVEDNNEIPELDVERFKRLFSKQHNHRVAAMRAKKGDQAITLIGFLTNLQDGKIGFIPVARFLLDRELTEISFDGKKMEIIENV